MSSRVWRPSARLNTHNRTRLAGNERPPCVIEPRFDRFIELGLERSTGNPHDRHHASLLSLARRDLPSSALRFQGSQGKAQSLGERSTLRQTFDEEGSIFSISIERTGDVTVRR